MPGEYGFIINAGGNVIGQMALFEESVAKFGATTKIQTKEVQQSFNLMGEGMASTFKNLKSLLLTGLGITALFEGWEFIENSKVKFEALEKQIVKVNTVLKSTGYAAGFSSQDIQNQSKELSKKIVNQRDEILQTQAVLLSQPNLRGDNFERALKGVADYTTFFGLDMQTGARVLSRVLQDPMVGMNMLRKANIVLSAQQKEQIKNYEEQGQLAKAQGVILDEINKKYGGQAEAYARTDAGKIQIASKAFVELQYRLGEIISRVEVSLIPSFIKIVGVIKDAFNSSVIQFFIAHIKDLVAIVLKLIPIWVTYKVVLLGISLITNSVALAQKLLAVSFGQTAIAVDGAIVSLDGFKAALVSTGIGALVVGIGLVIERLIDMNKELDDSIDKITNFSQTSEQAEQNATSYRELSARFRIHRQLGEAGQSELLSDLKNKLKDIQSSYDKVLNPSLFATTEQLKKEKSIQFLTPQKGETGADLAQRYNIHGQTIDKLTDTYKAQANQVDYARHQIKNLALAIQTLTGEGVKMPKYSGPSSGLQDNAYATSSLAGAKGGLGEAKVINIHIGTLQKNEGVHESASQSQAAVELLIRTLNNIAYSQASTF